MKTKYFSTRRVKQSLHIYAHIIIPAYESQVSGILAAADELIADYPHLSYNKIRYGRVLWFPHAVSAKVDLPRRDYEEIGEGVE